MGEMTVVASANRAVRGLLISAMDDEVEDLEGLRMMDWGFCCVDMVVSTEERSCSRQDGVDASQLVKL